MPVEVELGTPLASALQAEIQPKLASLGFGSGDPSDNALSEYIILMLVNGKSQEDIIKELSGDLLSVSPDDSGLREFSTWLFDHLDVLDAQYNGAKGESQDDSTTMGDDQEMDLGITDEGKGSNINAPTGPKAMRNGTSVRGAGRDKRIFGQINRAMDRSNDSVLHRIRGQSGTDRINSHSRGPPSGPRMGVGRQPRAMNSSRTASIVHGLTTGVGGMPPGPSMMGTGFPMAGNGGPWMMPGQGQGPPQMDVYAMLEQQSQMMAQMQQQMQRQMDMSQRPRNSFGAQRGGRLSDRVQHQNKNFRQGSRPQNGHFHQASDPVKAEDDAGGDDTDMTGAKREATDPEETICKFNLNCTNKDCKFAHQSPAAPRGITMDVKDVCSFGAACKNFKCVGRHPSPASRAAHQSEMDCKFFPNCTNPRCPFRHGMPVCRNGADCSVAGCKFTHIKTMCKYNPCTNRFCTFKHEEGQRGTFQDKVWTAENAKEHVSERKFVDENAVEDTVLPDQMITDRPAEE